MRKDKILLVDDEIKILEMCKIILSREGYDVKTAPSGEDALEMIEIEPPDLLFTDIRMPKMSGTELLTKVAHRYPNIPVVMITGYSSQDLVVEAMKGGAQAFIFKPFTLDELKSTASRLLERNRLIKEGIRLKAVIPLLETSRKLIECMEIEEIYDLAVSELLKTFKVDMAAMLLDENGTIEIAAQRGLSGVKERSALQALVEKINFKEKRQVIVEDGNSKNDEISCNNQYIVNAIRDDSGMATALVAGRPMSQGKFSEEELESINILSDHITSALERVSRYKKKSELHSLVKEVA